MNKRLISVLGVIALVILVCVVGAVNILIGRFSPSDERADLSEVFQVEGSDEIPIVLDGELSDFKGRLIDGELYIDYETASSSLNKKLYKDVKNDTLIYTTPLQIYKIPQDSKEYMIDSDKRTSDIPIFCAVGNVDYVSMDFIKEHSSMTCDEFQDPTRLVIRTTDKDLKKSIVKTDSCIRQESALNSPICKDLKEGDTVYLEETTKGWERVSTDDGYLGYVQKKHLSDPVEAHLKLDGKEQEYKNISFDKKINLAFHQVSAKEANDGLKKLLDKTSGITTVSPTWFFIKDEKGSFTSLGQKNYVDRAHKLGMQVWALVENISNEVNMSKLLSDTKARQKLIKGLVEEVKKLGADGINVDFEDISTDCAPHFLQFLRELSISCRLGGYVLSIDNPVPQPYNKYYDLGEQAQIADYVVIMGYDEHYAGGEEAGSVASIPFVEDGIKTALEEVPKAKLINAIPFYTRLWLEKTDGTLKSKAYGMDDADKFVEKHSMRKSWDAKTGQYYAEITKKKGTYRIWLEEEESITKKMELISSYDLGGVAEWKLGLERKKVWKIIESHLNQKS